MPSCETIARPPARRPAEFPELLPEALCALTNIASTKHTRAVVQEPEALPSLMALLGSADPYVREQVRYTRYLKGIIPGIDFVEGGEQYQYCYTYVWVRGHSVRTQFYFVSRPVGAHKTRVFRYTIILNLFRSRG